jgi:hypothetical protein
MARIKGGAGRKRSRRDSANLIEDPAKRLVAFSKHRPTLFTMAGNLSALCGVDTAVVVFSQSGKVYAFGSPSVDAVLRRYQPLVHVNDYLDGATAVAEEGGNGGASLAAMRQELDDTKARVKAEKERMKAVDASVLMAMAARRTQFWWQADVNALGAAELPEFEAALGQLRDSILRRVDTLHADALDPKNQR